MNECKDSNQAPFAVGDEVFLKKGSYSYTVKGIDYFKGVWWVMIEHYQNKYWVKGDLFMKTIKVSLGDVIITSAGNKLICTAMSNSTIAGYNDETVKFTQWDKLGNYVSGERVGDIKKVHSNMNITDTPEREEKKYTLRQFMTALTSKFPNGGWDSTLAHNSLEQTLDKITDPEYNEYIRLKAKFDTKKG